MDDTSKTLRRWVTFAGCVLVVVVLCWAQAVLVPIALVILLTFVITRLRRRTGWQIGEADDREPLRVDERHQFRGLQARTGNLDVKL
jgi:hypothetical protein